MEGPPPAAGSAVAGPRLFPFDFFLPDGIKGLDSPSSDPEKGSGSSNIQPSHKGRIGNDRAAVNIRAVRLAETKQMATTKIVNELVESGVHYGHQSSKWHPRMRPYILQKRSGIHIINVEETARQIEAASDFLGKLASNGKRLLFVGCKRQAQVAVKEAAIACGQFYVNHRWLGGTLTNLQTIRKSVSRLEYLEGIDKTPEYKAMSKKELSALAREQAKLVRNLDGIRGMEALPDALVVVDSAREEIAVAEARKLKIPIAALVDTNADPKVIDYPVAANDDGIRAIRVILQNLIDPIIVAKA